MSSTTSPSTSTPNFVIDQLVWEACRADDMDILCCLLAQGGRTIWYPPDAPDSMSCLCIAVGNGNSDMVEQLVKHGADVNLAGSYGQNTALHIATELGNIKLVKQLVKMGADINKGDEMGETALHKSCIQNNLHIVKELIKAGACLNALTFIGWTPLHTATRLGHEEVVRALLDAGADKNTRDVQSMTPLSCAVEHEHAKIALLLIDDNDTDWEDIAVEDFKQVLKLRASRVQETNRDTRRRGMVVIIIGSISMIICRSVVVRIQQRFK
jgi:ankyrin repeat protein